VQRTERGCSIILSRSSPELVRQLFVQEVPEASNGLIEITRVVRDPGVRSKIGVIGLQSGMDPVGACVGPRGSRVRNVVTELGGEKVDIVPLDVDPARFLAKSLSPARVREVELDDEGRRATVIVPDDEVSKAIGHRGQNVRLTAQLTDWKIDILSESQFAQLNAFEGGDDEEIGSFDGRCAATLGNGRRCPNDSLPGAHYCGLPRHAVLDYFPTNSVRILRGLENDAVASLLAGEDVERLVAQAEALNPEVYEEEAAALEQAQAESEARADELDAALAENGDYDEYSFED
jgi:transcription termination/antitermination protein NusA